MLVYLASEQDYKLWQLLIIATAGNSLGGMTSWGLGWLIASKYPSEKLLKSKQQHAITRIRQYGSAVLLLSWLPVVGDPLCVAAGWIRVRWYLAALYITLGKAFRYGVILYLVDPLL